MKSRIANLILCLAVASTGCDRATPARPQSTQPAEITAYCSVDTVIAEPILAEFSRRTGVKVHPVFDTEAGKTTGLVNRLLAERSSPRADVWWSGEIFGTMQLAAQGIFDPYAPKSVADVPAQYRDTRGLWTAVGLRGRVIAYDPQRTRREDLPHAWSDLMQPKYKGRFRMADPRFGTTRGHMATLLSLWGEPAMKSYYSGLRSNGVVLTDGNSQSVLHVTRGLADFAATDTDDVIAARLQGISIDMIYPDLDGPGGTPRVRGTLWIPSSVALVKGGPQTNAAKELVDYLVSADVEERLHLSDSRNVPVRKELRIKLKADAPNEALVDYAAGGRSLEASDRLVSEVLLK